MTMTRGQKREALKHWLTGLAILAGLFYLMSGGESNHGSSRIVGRGEAATIAPPGTGTAVLCGTTPAAWSEIKTAAPLKQADYLRELADRGDTVWLPAGTGVRVIEASAGRGAAHMRVTTGPYTGTDVWCERTWMR